MSHLVYTKARGYLFLFSERLLRHTSNSFAILLPSLKKTIIKSLCNIRSLIVNDRLN